MLTVSYESYSDDKGVETRVEQNDSTVLLFSQTSEGSYDAYIQSGGFKYLSAISGVHTFDLDYRSREGGSHRQN